MVSISIYLVRLTLFRLASLRELDDVVRFAVGSCHEELANSIYAICLEMIFWCDCRGECELSMSRVVEL